MSLESQDDSALSLKKRARRRLVGAITLVILMLIILPNILTNKSKVEQAPITINMQTPEADVVADPDVQLVENAAGELLPVITPEEDALASEDSEQKVVVGNDEAVTEQPAEKEAVEATDNSKVAAVKTTEDVVEQLKADAEKVAQKVAAIPEADHATVSNGGFVIQVGVFSKPENVLRLKAKIEGLGYASNTTKVNSGASEMIRLSVGEFVTREEADRALKKLNQEGLKDGLVKAVK